MTTIIMRSALVFHGHDPAPDVHSVEVDHYGDRRVITWTDVMQRRRERQQVILDHKRGCERTRAWRVYVAHFGNGLMGGWQAMIDRVGHSEWIDRDRKSLIPKLLRIFPLVLSLGEERDQWGQWKIEFAKRFKRRTQLRQPVGVAYVWWDGGYELRRVEREIRC